MTGLGLAAGILIGAKVPSGRGGREAAAIRSEAPATADPGTRLEAKGRAEKAKAALARALQEEGAMPGPPAVQTAAVSRVRGLQNELIRAETDRVERKDRTNQDADGEAARHREELLRVAYEEQLGTLAPEQQRAAKVSLLRAESDLADRAYQQLPRREGTAAGYGQRAPGSDATAEEHRAAAVRVSSGAVGALLGGVLGFGLFAYRDREEPGAVRRSSEAVGLMEPVGSDVEEAAGLELAEVMVSVAPLTLPRAGAAEAERVLDGARHGMIPVVEDAAQGLARVISQDVGSGFPQSREVFFSNRWSGRPGPLEEACRDVIYSVLLADWGKGIRSYAIVSPDAGDGKTTVLANMAVALGRAQLRVVLVDGDLQHPGVHEMFEVENRMGVRDLVCGEEDLANSSIDDLTLRTRFSHIAVVPAGTKDLREECFQSPRFSRLLERLTTEFDLVLVDTGSGPAGEASAIARQCGGAIELLRAGLTKREAALALRDELTREQAYVAGVCLNCLAEARDDSGYFDAA